MLPAALPEGSGGSVLWHPITLFYFNFMFICIFISYYYILYFILYYILFIFIYYLISLIKHPPSLHPCQGLKHPCSSIPASPYPNRWFLSASLGT